MLQIYVTKFLEEKPITGLWTEQLKIYVKQIPQVVVGCLVIGLCGIRD
jgi:hypothetical protein